MDESIGESIQKKCVKENKKECPLKKWDSLRRRIKKTLKEGWMLGRKRGKSRGALAEGIPIYIGVQAEEWL